MAPLVGARSCRAARLRYFLGVSAPVPALHHWACCVRRWVDGELLQFVDGSPLVQGARLGFVWTYPGTPAKRFLVQLSLFKSMQQRFVGRTSASPKFKGEGEQKCLLCATASSGGLAVAGKPARRDAAFPLGSFGSSLCPLRITACLSMEQHGTAHLLLVSAM